MLREVERLWELRRLSEFTPVRGNDGLASLRGMESVEGGAINKGGGVEVADGNATAAGDEVKVLAILSLEQVVVSDGNKLIVIVFSEMKGGGVLWVGGFGMAEVWSGCNGIANVGLGCKAGTVFLSRRVNAGEG